jgi:hypothetical protein
MDWKKIAIAIIIIAILGYGGWAGYRYIEGRLADNQTVSINQEIIELLDKQQGMIVKLQTEIADVERRVVADTLKEKVIVTEDSQTYEGIKEQLVSLRENEEENKEEIKALREVFEQRIDEFQESPDKIMVTSGDEKVVLYEDSEGNLVSLSEGVEIIRHRKAEPLLEQDLQAGQTIEEVNDNFSISMLYPIEGDFTPAISYRVLNWRRLSINTTAYDYNEPKLGIDLGYNAKGNLEVAGGVGLLDIGKFEPIKDYYIRAGIRIEF